MVSIEVPTPSVQHSLRRLRSRAALPRPGDLEGVELLHSQQRWKEPRAVSNLGQPSAQHNSAWSYPNAHVNQRCLWSDRV